MSFTSIRADIRTKEAECDRLFTELSEMVSNPTGDGTLEAQIDTNLEQRAQQLRELFRLAHDDQAAPQMAHQAQRHSEILEDHKKTSKRLRSAISQERSRRTLLSSVRQDIQTHRSGSAGASGAGTPNSQIEQTADAERYYGDELSRVNQSHSVVDTLLASAYEARAEMSRQQQTLKGVQKRMLHVMGRIPGVNSLISKINTRQKRNSLILAGVIVFGVLFIFFVR